MHVGLKKNRLEGSGKSNSLNPIGRVTIFGMLGLKWLIDHRITMTWLWLCFKKPVVGGYDNNDINIVICNPKMFLTFFQLDPTVTSSSMLQINHNHPHGFQPQPNMTPPGLQVQGRNHTNNSVQVTVGSNPPMMGPDFQSNPYLHHMIDNYSNLYQNHRGSASSSGGGIPVNPTSPTSSSSTNNSQSGSSNQGPSWLWW